MALNTDKNLKLYYSIKEVAQMINVSESLLRFWEKEIPQIKPKTTGNNIRQYTDKDIEIIKSVYNLVKVRGFKIAAARKMLHANKQGVDSRARVFGKSHRSSCRTSGTEEALRLPHLTLNSSLPPSFKGQVG